MAAHMSGEWFDLDGFFARPPITITLERLLIVDYLLAQGVLPGDLRNLPPEQAAVLFKKARRFARLSLVKIEPTADFSSYTPLGFSPN